MIIDQRQNFGEDSIHRNIIITNGTVSVVNGELVYTDATIRITNAELHSESLQITESICSDANLKFGACESSEIQFKFSATVVDLTNEILNVYIYSDNSVTTLMKLGTYRVAEDVASADRSSRSITGYDVLHDVLNADVTTWYDTILPLDSSTTTLGAMRLSLLNLLGITDVTDTTKMPNDALVVARTINPTSLSGATVIKAICELNGAFGHINRDGNFVSVRIQQGNEAIYPKADLYPSPDLYPRKARGSYLPQSKYIPPLDLKKYKVESITGVQIREESDDIGCTVGTTDNIYVVTGNFICYGMNATQMTTVANNVLGAITSISYYPFSVTATGNPLIEVGDYLRISSNTESIETICMKRQFSGIQALKDTYSADGEQKQSQKLNSVSEQLQRLRGATTKIKADVDGLAITVEQQLDDTVYGSYAYQTAQAIGAKVSSTGGTSSSFAYELTDSNFKLTSNSNEVFKCDSTGVVVKGTIKSLDGNSSTSMSNDGISFSTTTSTGRHSLDIVHSSSGSQLVADGMMESGYSLSAYNYPIISVTPDYSGGCSVNVNAQTINGYTPITSNNIGSYSVGYATNATNATHATSSNYANFSGGLLASDNYTSLDITVATSFSGYVLLPSGTMGLGDGSHRFRHIVTQALATGSGSSKTLAWKQLSSITSSDYILVGT